MADVVIRFLIGGLVVSLFAALGDVFKPKSFAGLFGASPSVALTTLALAFGKNGQSYVSIDGRSMMAGATAMLVYCLLSAWLLMRKKTNPLATAAASMVVWFAIAFGLYVAVLRGLPS